MATTTAPAPTRPGVRPRSRLSPEERRERAVARTRERRSRRLLNTVLAVTVAVALGCLSAAAMVVVIDQAVENRLADLNEVVSDNVAVLDHSITRLAEAMQSRPPPADVIHEDDPRWDCRTMGNRVCGSDERQKEVMP